MMVSGDNHPIVAGTADFEDPAHDPRLGEIGSRSPGSIALKVPAISNMVRVAGKGLEVLTLVSEDTVPIGSLHDSKPTAQTSLS